MNGERGTFLTHLPAIYHGLKDLGQLLDAFERVLLRAGSGTHKAIAQRIDDMHEVFDPARAEDGFIDWLGQWVALSDGLNMPIERRRALMANVVPMYEFRGTRTYLSQVLEYFTPESTRIEVTDRELPSLTVGASALGRDSWLGGSPAFWFRVDLRVPGGASDEAGRTRFERDIRAVIDLAKPAHSDYQLDCSWDRNGPGPAVARGARRTI